MVRVLSTAIAAALLSVGAASATKLYGINYNIRAGADWEPEETKCKSADVIAKELAQLKEITDTIRLYSLTDCNQAVKVLPAAAAAGLKVSLGLWVGPQPSTFEDEKAKLEELIAQGAIPQDTPAISVGSEALLRNDVNATVAIANAKAIKALCVAKGVKAPVTITDTTEMYLKYPSLVDAVDFVSPNIFPFWDKIAAPKGPEQLYGKLQKLAKITKGKDVVIGETGWPTDGFVVAGSKASMENAATYFKGFVALAEKYSIKYYYFAAFDEDWKTKSVSENSGVEPYFGMFDKDGNLKEAYSSLTTTPTVAPTVTPTVTPTVAPTVTPSSDGGLPTEGALTLAPAKTTPSATTATPAKTTAPSSGSTGTIVFPGADEDGDEYKPGVVIGGGGAAQNDSPKSGASTPTAAPTAAPTVVPGATEAPVATKKPKHKDCDA